MMSHTKTYREVLQTKYYLSQIAKSCISAIQSVTYAGKEYTCPCCEGSFRTFLPAGINHRPKAECPKCFSLERHRLLWLYLKNRTNLLSEKLKVLHFAPEFQLYRLIRKLPNIDYLTADLSAPRVMMNMDITNIPFADASFDVILCNHVLEHVPDDAKAIKELYRVLKPNGWAILQVPLDKNIAETFEDPNITSEEDRVKFYGQKDHLRLYGRDYKNRLEAAGFQVKVEDYIHELGDDLTEKYRLVSEDSNTEDIYFCTKLSV
ncbi:class I SAM-dependent methyltransferase [Fischerella thermalis]|jgi:predicted SAM-dependent methyltransferase|uniref:Methyltransferase type 11 n=1 Tax=Fischerella thermalis JSC-11 TaxID=741277 RepID=G6FSU3_9CYAN|nr:class I SAM-dependent methyltransferase [Fischerella thermalis]MBF1991415.1 methyltransferase domain-containing protein [Fischerella thermalis M58_A2018_009]PLZ20912.1 SAM-dependent methyltransferase [Fischerella thermalis WC157]PLZ21303.1 SAM-dependent methyltransferase [Fischerella thermalis WC559]PLZ43004.1 SAM-dependent methyltransferase [Fischerella thermalis WC538]PLZ63976.1 SAM-dependent methyltransferase [Fischerella thermalis WC344]PLZ75083.1 SAM-dependent methyltransferase [Fisch